MGAVSSGGVDSGLWLWRWLCALRPCLGAVPLVVRSAAGARESPAETGSEARPIC